MQNSSTESKNYVQDTHEDFMRFAVHHCPYSSPGKSLKLEKKIILFLISWVMSLFSFQFVLWTEGPKNTRKVQEKYS